MRKDQITAHLETNLKSNAIDSCLNLDVLSFTAPKIEFIRIVDTVYEL